MFFNLILLNQQHKGRFGHAWVAATRGIQHLNKNTIIQLDLSKLCDDLVKYICSQSESPQKRFSLRLSAVLLNGTIKIYRQQATFFLDDLVRIMTVITKPPVTRTRMPSIETSTPETPPTPILKKKRTKRKVVQEESTPQSEIDKLLEKIKKSEGELVQHDMVPELEAARARVDEVTIHEPQVSLQVPGLEHGTLGPSLTEEELMELPAEYSVLPSKISLARIEEVPESPAEVLSPLYPREEIRKSTSESSEPDVGPVRITVEAQVLAPADAEGPLEIRRRRPTPKPKPTSPIEKPIEMPPETRPARAVLEEIQLDEVEERDRRILDKKRKALMVSLKRPTRIVRINRCGPHDIEWIEVEAPIKPQFKLKTPNLTNLLNMYLVREESDLEKRKASEEQSAEDSRRLLKKSDRLTSPVLQITEDVVQRTPVQQEEPMQIGEEQLVQISAIQPSGTLATPDVAISDSHLKVPEPMVLTSTPIRRSETEQRSIEERLLESPRKRRRLMTKESEAAREFLKDLHYLTVPAMDKSHEVTEEAAMVQTEFLDSVSVPVPTQHKRHQEIFNKICISDRLTLEEICEKPVNRMNIARAFGDLLVLSAHGYVTLVAENGGTELKFVEKGRKVRF